MKNIKDYKIFCEGNEGGRLSPKDKIEYPMLYGIMTKELSDKLTKNGTKPRPIGIMNDGYIFICKTPEDFEKCKKDYIVGNEYEGEKIIAVSFGTESQYGN